MKEVQKIEIPDILADFLKSPGTFQKQIELQEWLKDNDENQRIFNESLDIWQASEKVSSLTAYNPGEAWIKLKKNIVSEKSPKKINLLKLFAAAAAVLIIFISSYYIYTHNSILKQSKLLTEYIVPYGSKSQVTLPDGSKVWLNAGSVLSYNGLFANKDRTVNLSGEAYFDVVKSKHTFVVKTNDVDIVVKGTRFNVKAYPEENKVETTVERGVVEVINKKEKGKKIALFQNQKAVYYSEKTENLSEKKLEKENSHSMNAEKSIAEFEVDKNIISEVYTSWKDNIWIIEREYLKDLAVKLERKYNIDIIFKDDELKNYIFSGVLKDETLSQVLEAIKLTAPVSFTIDEKTVTLYENKKIKSSLNK